jgi:uncharacterized protein (TIGR03435 family)
MNPKVRLSLMKYAAYVLFATGLAGGQAAAQVVARPAGEAGVSFSVVSIKPTAPGSRGGGYKTTTDSIIAENYPIYAIVSIAYALGYDPRTKVGFPSWAMDERYDIVAKVDEADIGKFSKLSKDDKGKLLQQVLVERTGLKFHTEAREFPVWALVVARGGPKLSPATGKSEAGDKLMWQITGRYKLDARNGSMYNLCYMLLSTEAQEITVDETHLDGLYDFTLSWTRPDQEGTTDAPEIFTAIKEQLGLELVKRKITETVLVVDEMHRPTPN